MKETILFFFTCMGVSAVSTIAFIIIWAIIDNIKTKVKKCKQSSNDKSNNQTIEELTIEATNDKQYVDEALSDCDYLINVIKTCEKQNKLSKDVEIIDESIHKYRLLISFDKIMIYDDNLNPQIDFDKYVEKYNYNHSLVLTRSTKELLMIQTFALKFFEDYMFPNTSLYHYGKGRDGICKMEFIHDENVNKYILKFEYIYGTTSVNHNYPILDGYYFGCMVGSQILVNELLDMLDSMEHVLNIDTLSSPAAKKHIKDIFIKMRNTLNSKKFPQFKD